MATKVLIKRSERVKSVDFHPTKPWILASLYTGTVSIWNYHSQTTEKSIKVTESPVRTAKFIASRSWIVCGSDDGFIRVYDYKTWKKVTKFKAHIDFILCLAVHHAKSPLVLSASRDKLIKLWNWKNDWVCQMVFPGHSEPVTYIAFRPGDHINTFASASLDCTVKVWYINSSDAKRTFKVPDSKGINCVNWFRGDGDKQYLIIGCNDCTAKVLNYETVEIVATLKRHKEKVTAAYKHPELPYLITASTDGTVILWEDVPKYKPYLPQLDYNLGAVQGIACKKGSNRAAFGCDKGVIVVPKLHPAPASASLLNNYRKK